MVKDFPQTGDITVKVTVKYTVDNTQVERVLQSTDEFFNDSASKYSVIGVLLRRGDPVFGYFDAVVAEDDEFCVRIRSSVNDRCCVLLPVDSIIGWFYL